MHRGYGAGKKLRVLALAWQHHHDELYADFQQYYRLDLWSFGLDGDETTQDVLRAAILTYQLPRDSRMWAAILPVGVHDESRQLLRRIEYNQRALAWARADKKKRGPEPDPVYLSGEEAVMDEKLRRDRETQEEVAEFFGIDL